MRRVFVCVFEGEGGGGGALFLVQYVCCLPFVGINKNGNFNTQPKLCVDLYTSLAFNVLSSLRAE